MLAGREQVKPAGVEAETDKFTGPVNPLRAVIVIVESPVEPALMMAGLTVPADMPKSTTWKRIEDDVWDRVASAPVTVTL